MSIEHTPGPWKYDRYGYIESPSTGLPICSMQPAGNLEGKARQRANAALIAAAPDMLAALIACCEPTEPGEDCCLPTDLYNKVCAIIAKAEGRS